MSQTQSVSFKAYVPIRYYAKHPRTNEYIPVLRRNNIKKCNSFVVKNLNNTIKTPNEDFINLFSERDADYRDVKKVQSFYDNRYATVYLFTGKDAKKIKEFAKPLGQAKNVSKEITGSTKSFETAHEADKFVNKVKDFLAKVCCSVKNDAGEKLMLKVYFNPKYDKHSEIDKFIYDHAEFVPIKQKS